MLAKDKGVKLHKALANVTKFGLPGTICAVPNADIEKDPKFVRCDDEI